LKEQNIILSAGKEDDHRKLLAKRDLTIKRLRSEADTLDFVGFKINNMGSPNPLTRNTKIAEEPYRVNFKLHNLKYIIKDESKVEYIEGNKFKLIKIHVEVDKGYITIEDILIALDSCGLDLIRETECLYKRLDKGEVILHSTDKNVSLTILLAILTTDIDVEELLHYERILDNYYVCLKIKEFDVRYIFSNGVEVSPNKYIVNFEEIKCKIDNDLKNM